MPEPPNSHNLAESLFHQYGGMLRTTEAIVDSALAYHEIMTEIPYEVCIQVRVDSIKRLQSGTAAELDTLLPSILDQACKGEL